MTRPHVTVNQSVESKNLTLKKGFQTGFVRKTPVRTGAFMTASGPS